MHPQKILLSCLQLVVGPLVLGSYVYSVGRYPDLVGAMWGGVPDALRPIYTAWMFVAAAGYLTFTYLFLFRTAPDSARVLGSGYGILNLLYALVLFPSAAWMPLTGEFLEGPSLGLWWLVKADLWLTLTGSLGLLAATVTLTPAWPGRIRGLAIASAVGFCIQTVLLDGIVWVWLFPAFF